MRAIYGEIPDQVKFEKRFSRVQKRLPIVALTPERPLFMLWEQKGGKVMRTVSRQIFETTWVCERGHRATEPTKAFTKRCCGQATDRPTLFCPQCVAEGNIEDKWKTKFQIESMEITLKDAEGFFIIGDSPMHGYHLKISRSDEKKIRLAEVICKIKEESGLIELYDKGQMIFSNREIVEFRRVTLTTLFGKEIPWFTIDELPGQEPTPRRVIR